MRDCGRHLLALGLVFALGASAQQVDPPPVREGRMYLNAGILIGSTRLVSLGGAFVGIAEGAASFTSNLAAIAHRKPALADPWTVDVALSYLDLPLGNPEAQDLDNDGQADDARQVRQLVFGLFVQFHEFGVGGYSRATSLRYCLAPPCEAQGDLALTLVNTAIAGAVAFGADELIVAAGLYATTGELRFGELRFGDLRWSYGSSAVTADALWRPPDRNFRVGLSFKPQVVANLGTENPPPFAGARPFEAVASPWILSLGGSLRLGPGAERFNQLSIFKLRQLHIVPQDYAAVPERADPPGRWMLVAQVDLLAPVEKAVPIRAVLDSAPPPRIARTYGFEPRFGIEHETLPGRLRLRLGTLLEPSPVAAQTPCLHLTGGAELFLFHALDDWTLSASFDVASRYSDFGISVGFWR